MASDFVSPSAMTKLNEEVFRTTLADAAAYYADAEPRGEYVLILASTCSTTDREAHGAFCMPQSTAPARISTYSPRGSPTPSKKLRKTAACRRMSSTTNMSNKMKRMSICNKKGARRATTDEFVFYSVPRYRFYYRAADGEGYMTACDAILFDGK